jgi:hypothetical protein
MDYLDGGVKPGFLVKLDVDGEDTIDIFLDAARSSGVLMLKKETRSGSAALSCGSAILFTFTLEKKFMILGSSLLS